MRSEQTNALEKNRIMLLNKYVMVPGDGSGTKLAGVSRLPDRTDVFMIGADANLYSAVWSGSG
jgi:hypothetical protein